MLRVLQEPPVTDSLGDESTHERNDLLLTRPWPILLLLLLLLLLLSYYY